MMKVIHWYSEGGLEPKTDISFPTEERLPFYLPLFFYLGYYAFITICLQSLPIVTILASLDTGDPSTLWFVFIGEVCSVKLLCWSQTSGWECMRMLDFCLMYLNDLPYSPRGFLGSVCVFCQASLLEFSVLILQGVKLVLSSEYWFGQF